MPCTYEYVHMYYIHINVCLYARSGLTGPGLAWPCTERDFRWRFIFTFHACKTCLRVEVEIRARDVATLRQRPQRRQQQHINMNTNMTDTDVSLCACTCARLCMCVCVPVSLDGPVPVCESVWNEHRVKISEPQTVNSYRDKLQLLYASSTTSTNRVSKKDNNNNESSGKVKMTINRDKGADGKRTNANRNTNTNERARTYIKHMYVCMYIHVRTHTWSYIRMYVHSEYVWMQERTKR